MFLAFDDLLELAPRGDLVGLTIQRTGQLLAKGAGAFVDPPFFERVDQSALFEGFADQSRPEIRQSVHAVVALARFRRQIAALGHLGHTGEAADCLFAGLFTILAVELPREGLERERFGVRNAPGSQCIAEDGAELVGGPLGDDNELLVFLQNFVASYSASVCSVDSFMIVLSCP